MVASSTERMLGSYQLLSQLAVGGMAEIYVARASGLSGFEKLVALKVIHPNYSADPEFVQMLVDEAKLSVQLQHANIVQTFDLGCVDEQYYITMELVEGIDLYKLLKRASEHEIDFPFELAAFVAGEVCAGLDYAHRKKDERGRPLEIVHRDVSPQNVLISYDGEVKLVDFGIAKAALRGQRTAAGVIKGKYFYMSPEQAWGDPIDARSDIFSAGILLYEMLVGQMLYREQDLEKLLVEVRKAAIAPPSTLRPGVPERLEKMVMRALQKRAADRYPSAGELAGELGQFVRSFAPDFTRARLAAFVKLVLEDDPTAAHYRDPRQQTAHVEPSPKGAVRDKHSLIFKLSAARRPADTSPSAPTGFEENEETLVDAGEAILSRMLDAGGPGGASSPRSARPAPLEGVPEPVDDEDDDATTGALTLPRLPRAPLAPPPRQANAPIVHIEDSTTDPLPERQRPTVEMRAPSPPPVPPAPPIDFANPTRAGEPRPLSRFEEPTRIPGPPLPAGDPFIPAASHAESTPQLLAPQTSSGVHLGRAPALSGWVIAALALVVVGAVALFSYFSGSERRGTLSVVSLPPSAEVRVDGATVAQMTPIQLNEVDVRQTHHVRVSKPGYDAWESDVRFPAGELTVQVQAVLSPAVGTLEISSAPAGAEAIVNGRIRGLTPVTVGDLPPNEDVVIELRLRGYKVEHRVVSFDKSSVRRALAVSITLEKAR